MRRCWLAGITVICAACGSRELSPIRLESIVTLGADSGDGAIANTPRVSPRHPNGFRVVVPSLGAIASLPLVFGDQGAYLGALRGDSARTGTAAEPAFARFGPGDSIWVFDNTRRIDLFDPSRRYVRTIPISLAASDGTPPFRDAMILPDGRIVASTAAPATAQLFSGAGVLERDIGPPDPANHTVAVVRGADGTVWTAASGLWRIQQWDTAGRLLKTIEPEPRWSIDSNAAVRRGSSRLPDVPPPPMIAAIWVDTLGRLWVLGEVADRQWRDGYVAADSLVRRHIESDKYYDTIVEVRDPDSGAVIASARFDIHCASIAEPGVLVHEIVTRAGWVRAELLRVVLDEKALGKTR